MININAHTNEKELKYARAASSARNCCGCGNYVNTKVERARITEKNVTPPTKKNTNPQQQQQQRTIVCLLYDCVVFGYNSSLA